MATSNATLKCKWTTGIIYAVVIAVISAVVIWFGLNYAMPVTLTVLDQFDMPVEVNFTDTFFYSSRRVMLVSVIFPAFSYLLMYYRYTVLVGKYPYRKEEVKKGKLGKPWILSLVLQLVLMAVWGIVSWVTVSLGMALDLTLLADRTMFQRYMLVYGGVTVLDAVLLILGQLFFKPAEVQRA